MTSLPAHDSSAVPAPTDGALRRAVLRPPAAPSSGTGSSPRARRGPSPRFLRDVQDPAAREDIRTLAFFVRIYCDGNHAGRARAPHSSDAQRSGVYPDGPPTLCADCSEHLAYGEARRVFCTVDPKPFCAHCEVHCFKDSERAWNRQMMRYSGPRSLLRGYALDGARHLAGSLRLRMRTAWTRIRPVGR